MIKDRVYYQTTAIALEAKVSQLRKELDLRQANLLALRKECPHPFEAFVQNYDEMYIIVKCADCGKESLVHDPNRDGRQRQPGELCRRPLTPTSD